MGGLSAFFVAPPTVPMVDYATQSFDEVQMSLYNHEEKKEKTQVLISV